MEQPDWIRMLEALQELHHLSRSILIQGQKQPLTASELELLSRLLLQDRPATPMELSRQTGMKKEAVSRCLRQLTGKGFISREKHSDDERSYGISITPAGHDALETCYGPILRPIFALQRSMGTDFAELFRLIAEANRLTENRKDEQE